MNSEDANPGTELARGGPRPKDYSAQNLGMPRAPIWNTVPRRGEVRERSRSACYARNRTIRKGVCGTACRGVGDWCPMLVDGEQRCVGTTALDAVACRMSCTVLLISWKDHRGQRLRCYEYRTADGVGAQAVGDGDSDIEVSL